MMKYVVPLLLQLMLIASQKENLMVDAKHGRIVRGSQPQTKSIDGLSHRELPEASTAQNDRLLKNNNNKQPSPRKPTPQKEQPKDRKEVPNGAEKKPPGRKDKDKANEKEKEKEDSGQISSPPRNPTSPTVSPVPAPTRNPTSPTNFPVPAPTRNPTSPTVSPVPAPTRNPTSPTVSPVPAPTRNPTSPTVSPVSSPTRTPTTSRTSPISTPTNKPAISPTMVPYSEELQAPVSRPSVVEAPKAVWAPSSYLGSIQTKKPTTIREIIQKPESDQSPDNIFEASKFVAEEKLQPITFSMTTNKFTQLMNEEELELYFKYFLEDVLDMRLNQDWYSFNLKTVENVTIGLRPKFAVEESRKQRSTGVITLIELIVNGRIVVHSNEDNQQTNAFPDSAPQSTFNETFDYSMLLYFTFWGADRVYDIQRVLEDGGLQNPVLDSISVGENRLIIFDRTDKNLRSNAQSSAGNRVSAGVSKNTSVILIMLFCVHQCILW